METTTAQTQDTLEQEALLDFLLRFATIQTSVGVQTSRIVLNTTRVAEAYGYDITMMLFQRNVAISLIPHRSPSRGTYREAHPTTGMTHHRSLPLNFLLNAELSRLSWWAYDTRPAITDLATRLDEVLASPRVNRWMILLLISVANAAFCLLFGGDATAASFVWIGTALAFYVRQELNLRHAYHYLTVFVAAFLSSLVAGLCSLTGWSETPEVALGTSVLFLIPGVPFINSMIDFFDGYILNGVSRIINAIFIVLSITLGLSITLLLLNLRLV